MVELKQIGTYRTVVDNNGVVEIWKNDHVYDYLMCFESEFIADAFRTLVNLKEVLAQ